MHLRVCTLFAEQPQNLGSNQVFLITRVRELLAEHAFYELEGIHLISYPMRTILVHLLYQILAELYNFLMIVTYVKSNKICLPFQGKGKALSIKINLLLIEKGPSATFCSTSTEIYSTSAATLTSRGAAIVAFKQTVVTLAGVHI